MMRVNLLIFFIASSLAAASGQNLTISGKNLVAVFGVHQIAINANLILYFDYVDADSDPDDISKIKVLYTDNSLNAYDSLSFDGYISDSLKLMSLSPSKFKNGKVYFTQNFKNKYNDTYYIVFCSFDPMLRVFEKYGTYTNQKKDLIYAFTLATSNDSTDYIYYGTSFETTTSTGTFPQLFLLFNTVSKKYEIPAKQLEMSTILQHDFSYHFLDYIYKYDIENKKSVIFKYKYVHAGFGGEAYGNKIDNSLYINGRMNGSLGASMTKYDIGLNKVFIKYFEMYDETCIIPAVTNDEVKELNEKLYLPFTTIDPRLCNILEVVYYDSPPNKYGLFVLDKDLNVCDTIVFQNEDYRLALMKFSVNDSTIALTGPIFPNNSIYSKQSFVHFININEACKTNLVDEISDPNGVVIYPNPADDFLNISIPENINIESIQIMDMMGRIVKETQLNKNRIDIKYLIPGIYFLKIADKNHIYRSYKFIKI